ncbi:NADP-dependent oxidoreductase domain-containing protein [Ochromonadaceae sp. CCMP2298]|nr:NADP-dependent oxidoreductase domain-containing protein [Ochromonadaceae sp. CCMP2298]
MNEHAQLRANNVEPEQAYERIVQRHSELTKLYSQKIFQCPKVRFGRTELQMPILTLGGMRQQLTWSPKADLTLEGVDKDNQANFEKVVQRAMELGINHFETARGYGSSELQYGPILKTFPRASFILQTKVPPMEDSAKFRSTLETSFTQLQLDHGSEDEFVDLFSFHGVNLPKHVEWITRPGGNMEVVKEYQQKGLIRHVGFTSHGMTPCIVAAIETGVFDYVNLHYHVSAMGGNVEAVLAAQKQDMGVFCISPTDKGGALYEPSTGMYKACLPLTPIAFNNLWLWNSPAPVHTLVIGAARPSDFDEHLEAAMMYPQRAELVAPVEAKLNQMVADVFGADFKDSWFKGLPDAYSNPEGLPLPHLYWLYWLIKAWGMYSYALKRYTPLEGGLKGWDDTASFEQNTKGFSWVPGVGYRPEREAQLRDILKDHPKCEEVVAAIKQLHAWLTAGGCLKRGETGEVDWAMAYDLQPSLPFCERVAR